MQLQLDLQPGDERLFVDESLEQIERLEQGLLGIERGDTSAATVNEVFRAAHTLKGSAATIRHTRMAELTHAAESVFGALREGRIDGLGAFMEPLLDAIDVLRRLVDEVSAGETLTEAPEALTTRLVTELAGVLGNGGQAASAGAAGAGAASAGSPQSAEADPLARLVAAHPASAEDGVREALRCTADETSPWKAVRLLQAVLEADESGALVASDPPRDALEAGVDVVAVLLLVRVAGADLDGLRLRIAMIDELAVEAVAVPAAAPDAGAGAAGEDAEAGDRRQIDLGPEARGTTADERLEMANVRLKLAQQTVRIDVARLDELMNLVGELVVHKTRLVRQAKQIGTRLSNDDPLAMEAEASAQQYARIASQLQDQVTRLRMLPIETVFNRFPRLIRDLSVRLGKEVELVIEGQETELDRSVLEQVGDPLGHLVRNALDHGLEPPDERRAAGKNPAGRLRLAAWHADGRIVIVVEDDGRGIDPDVVRRVAVAKEIISEQAAAAMSDDDAAQLIFAPGFSTARVVTDVSGRGVGTDVVRTNIERLGGRVTLYTERGRGSRFELSLPLTLAIVGALLVRTGRRVCALPLASVVETVRVERDAVSRIRGLPAVVLRNRVIPVERLEEALGDPPSALEAGTRGYVYLAIVRSGRDELALAVDAFLGEQEIVLKSLTGMPGRQPGVAGATVMADGSVALVVDVSAVVERRTAIDRGRPRSPAGDVGQPQRPEIAKRSARRDAAHALAVGRTA